LVFARVASPFELVCGLNQQKEALSMTLSVQPISCSINMTTHDMNDLAAMQGVGSSYSSVAVPAPMQVLDEPGSADLSTWVDFGALRQAAVGSGASVRVCGPVKQADFLLQLGLQQRLQRLMQVCAAHLPAHSFSDHASIKGQAC
jgi:hypothetical protein